MGLDVARHRADPGATPMVPELRDLRFKTLLGEESWADLPAATRHRFSKRLTDGATAIYVGRVVEIEASLAGRALALAAQLIGGPLPLVWTPSESVVTVTEDGASGGQVWTRLYARPRGFPQVIHSAKRFAGPTRLEEYLGRGFGMALTVAVQEGALVFRADHYFFSVPGLRLRLPAWCAPGRLTITHRDLGEGRFSFTLDLEHPRLGRLVRQHAEFCET